MHAGDGYYRRSNWQRREPSAGSAGGIWCQLACKRLTDELVRQYNDETVLLALGEGYFAVQVTRSIKM